ncbi:glycosyltransferase [Candidatus Woesearchaeota archaeon]|nr:glycosyltransferase [Candidatus Woesearchaeota archaeon]
MKLSIVIPAFNEEKRIAKTLDDYLSTFLKNCEIIVMIGGEDHTLDVVKNFRYKNLKFFYNKEDRGKGWAVRKGLSMAKGDIIAYVDADDATRAKELKKLIANIKGYDGVIASRWMKGSKLVPKQTLGRRLASRTFNFLTRLMFGLRYNDTQCGAKVFRKEAVQSVLGDMRSEGFVFDVELLYRLKRNGFVVKEVPTEWHDMEGSSVSVAKEMVRMLFSLVKLRYSV